jgi:antitoxin FitA
VSSFIAHHNGTVLVSSEETSVPTNITLKNVPDNIYQSLKRSADVNRRSINGEAIACLGKALTHSGGATPERLETARRIRAQLNPAHFTRRGIRDSIRRGRA